MEAQAVSNVAMLCAIAKVTSVEYSSILLEAVDVSQQRESTSLTRIDGPAHDSV